VPGRRSAGWVPQRAPEPAGRPPRAGLDELRARMSDRLPPAVRSTRWSVPAPAAAVALLLAVAVAGVVLVAQLLTGPQGPRPVPARTAPVPSPAASPVPAGTTAPTGVSAASPAPAPGVGGAPSLAGVVVHVVGQVAAPGLVELPAGSRVADAVQAAGGAGADADLARVNLARPLVDGEQVLVPRPGEQLPAPAGTPVPPAAPGGTGAAPSGAPVDLNAVDLAALDALPGIGPVLAQRILEWRQQHGRFSSVDELGEVSGIGERVLEQLRPLVRV
jgi:competence protein ComEA